MATTYLNRSVTGNNNSVGKWTFSCWVKRTELGNTTHLFNFYTDTNNRGGLRFNSDDTLLYYELVSNTSAVNINTNAVFRDTSAWYHIVLEVDKTISTPDTKIYVNGTSQTFQTDSDYTQNESTIVNSNTNLYINSEDGSNNIRDQILTHVHWIDGTAYDASTFGEYDAQNVWKPKTAPSVTYGTNGFFLKFANAGSLGTDSSPNGNNFTVNGTGTQTLDTPSNVFATLNALTKTNASITFDYGNTSATGANGVNWLGTVGTIGADKGKWYAEAKITDPLNFSIGFAKFGGTFQNNMNTPNSGYLGIGNDSWGFWGNGASANLFHNNTNTSYGSVTSTNDIMMLAMDLDNGNLYWGKNGTWFNSSNPATSTSPAFSGINIDEYITFGTGVEGGSVQWNFGNGYFGTTAVSTPNADGDGYGKFEYSVPTGYYALCTKNIQTYG